MTIGVIATLTVAEGKNAEFEGIFAQLSEKVNSLEEGCNFYGLHHSRENPQVYKVLEQYVDQAALDAHGTSEHMKTIGGKLGSVMGGRPEVEYFDSV